MKRLCYAGLVMAACGQAAAAERPSAAPRLVAPQPVRLRLVVPAEGPPARPNQPIAPTPAAWGPRWVGYDEPLEPVPDAAMSGEVTGDGPVADAGPAGPLSLDELSWDEADRLVRQRIAPAETAPADGTPPDAAAVDEGPGEATDDEPLFAAPETLPHETSPGELPWETGRRVAMRQVDPRGGAGSDGPFEIIDHSGELEVMLRRSKLLRTEVNVYRTAVVDPGVCSVVQFTPREISLIGLSQGATHVTFWFEDDQHQPVTYLVRVVPDPEVQQRREEQYELMEEILLELFPDSKIRLIPVSDKLIVRGQAKGAEEAAQIMSIIRAEVYGRAAGGGGIVFGAGLAQGRAAEPLVDQDEGMPLPPSQVINMLRIPGEQQVALRVKIAELNRSAARRFGVDTDLNFSQDGMVHFLVASMLNASSGSSSVLAGSFGNAAHPLDVGLHYLEQEGVVRILSEPTLVTLSGRPATFVAGGEFAVPTTVGVGGASAVTTDFRSFGAILTFLPVVMDKDRIRLEVAPEFSQRDDEGAVGGVPGLNTRAVTTTVELREGQTLVIAGLLEDTMDGQLRYNLPIFRRIFGLRNISRAETELVILVSPELVHAMEPEEVPPLPGFDVTEPTNREFFLNGRLEGLPTREYRSTVWPRLRHRYRSGGVEMISGPFGHGN